MAGHPQCMPLGLHCWLHTIWLFSIAAVTAFDLELEGLKDGAHSNVSFEAGAASFQLSEDLRLEVSGSSELLKWLPRPGERRISSFLSAILSSVKEWLFGTQPVPYDLEASQRRLQPGTAFPCRPRRRPAEYPQPVLSIPPEYITACVEVKTEEIFKVNHQIVDMSFGQFGGLEALMLAQRRGPVRYIEVIPTGDYAHYDVNRKPLKTFRDHSCLDKDKWCFVSQVQPIEYGFLVVDRHRVIHYNYTWLVEGNTAADEIPDVFVSQFGIMNSDGDGLSEDAKLNFPTAVAEYSPYNATLVSLSYEALSGVSGKQFEITAMIPHAWCRLLFVTDTGNHRVMILNASNVGQFDYVGQYGITGETRDNSTGFNWPWGIAVGSPAWEGRYEPSYANVFVVDRRNHRLVKLNLGYPLLPCEFDNPTQTPPLLYDEDQEAWMCRRYDKPRLSWSSEYGRQTDVYNRPKGLNDPCIVSLYRHFVVVSEVGGNAITLLRVNHQPPYDLLFVSYFKPVAGVSLQGGLSVSTFGYIWYNYIASDGKFAFSSMFLPENLRESPPPSRFKDFLKNCVNITWYAELIEDSHRFIEHMGFVLNASVINWINPDEPNYIDVYSFNKSGTFDLDYLNSLVYNGTMVTCDPPTTPTPPPFFGGNKDGWVIDGQSQSEFTKRSGVHHSSISLTIFICMITTFLMLHSL